MLNVRQSGQAISIFSFWLNKGNQLTIRIWHVRIYVEMYHKRPQISCMNYFCYIVVVFFSSSSSSSSSSSALHLWQSLGFLNNVLPFKAILDLFYPFYKFHLSQVVPYVTSHRDLGLSTGILANGFHLYIFVTVLVLGILFMRPNRLNLWALT